MLIFTYLTSSHGIGLFSLTSLENWYHFFPSMNPMPLSKSRNQKFSHKLWITDFITGHWKLELISPVQWCQNGTSTLMNSSWVLSISLAFPFLSLHISKEESSLGSSPCPNHHSPPQYPVTCNWPEFLHSLNWYKRSAITYLISKFCWHSCPRKLSTSVLFFSFQYYMNIISILYEDTIGTSQAKFNFPISFYKLLVGCGEERQRVTREQKVFQKATI